MKIPFGSKLSRRNSDGAFSSKCKTADKKLVKNRQKTLELESLKAIKARTQITEVNWSKKVRTE